MISDRQVSMHVQEVICQAPPTWLNHAEELFLNNLDFFKPIQVNSHPLTGQSSERTEVFEKTKKTFNL